jgi:hypothetical protein
MLIPAIECDPAHIVGVPDSHVVKLVAELLQIVSTAAPSVLDAAELATISHLLVKPTHAHHPYTRWAASARAHVMWLVRAGAALCAEKRRRWPANAPHCYESRYAALLELLPPDMRALPAALDEAQLPAVCVSETSVPNDTQRAVIRAAVAAGQRTRAFRLYYVFAKLSNPRIARFGGAAETAARRVAKRQNRPYTLVLPEPWASFALTAKEQAS